MMKKTKYIIMTIAAIVLISFIGDAQTDSTGVNTQELNQGIQSLIPYIFKAVGFSSPVSGIIITLIMILVRFIEKKLIKTKTAQSIRNVIHETQTNESTLPPKHVGALRKLIDKLEGVKEIK